MSVASGWSLHHLAGQPPASGAGLPAPEQVVAGPPAPSPRRGG